MRVAITSQNFRTITGHAGKTRRFLVYEVAGGGEPKEVERLDLPQGMALHDYHGDDHPLYGLGLDVIITGGAGQGFVQRMARFGIQVLPTAETDIVAALGALASGQPLPAAEPHAH
jgi:predicted Fe-Mo cluster-binding NifX family protein